MAQGQKGREETFPSDGLQIPGTMLLPAGEPPVEGWPVVVLVQGSGPNDRDETIGPNKPFRDLAEGLAALGVATLRYDKRTYLWRTGKVAVTPETMAQVSLGTEVVDDAVGALRWVSGQPGVDRKRVFLLGHSLGASLAPRIARERLKEDGGSVRGVMLLAGAAVPVTVLLPYQTAFQGLLRGGSVAETEAGVGKLDAGLREAMDPAAAAGTTVMGAPAAYWREWAALDVAGGLRALGLPALVLHGARDVQVFYPDFVLLAKAAVAPGSRADDLPGLNHLFFALDGESTGAEYGVAGHMAPVVAETIAAWLPK